MAEVGPSIDMSGLALKSEVPQAATTAPRSEATSATVGAQAMKYAREDHQHPRITSSRNLTLDANGEGVATFTRAFSTEPVAAFAQITGVAGPCIFQIVSWIMTGSDYTGANIKGWKMEGPSQTLASVTIVGISAAVGSQNITKYGPAAGVRVSVVMLPDSGV